MIREGTARRRAPFAFAVVALAAALSNAGLSTAAAEAPRVLQAPVWVYAERVPGSRAADDAVNDAPPLDRLGALSRFVLSGMVYGWKFSYVPYDKKRGVAESFSLAPLAEIAEGDPRFSIPHLKPSYPRLICVAEYSLDESHARWITHWDSVMFRTSKGRGAGERTDETLGIRAAYENAIRAAVRDHARRIEKNKPKEIVGEVLLRDNPRLFPDEGRFVAEVRVLINVREIVPYRSF